MEKKKFRVNILDLLIVALVLLCIAGAVLRVYVKNNDDKLEAQKAVVSFLIQDIQRESVDKFKDGDRLYCYELECELGTILGDVEWSDAIFYDALDTGEIKYSYSPGLRADVNGKFLCEGTWTKESGFALNGTHYIAPNMDLYVAFNNIKAQIKIMSIEVQ